MKIKVSFVTDIEGNYDYFLRFCELSEIVTLENDELDFLPSDQGLFFLINSMISSCFISCSLLERISIFVFLELHRC